jgi:predicted nucleic acid-binding protein
MIALDASVIAKWFLEEPKSSEALYYRDLHAQKKEIIIAPSILIYEMANFFRYKKDFTEREIVLALESLENFKIEIFNLGFKDIIEAVLLARERNITVYDSAYLLVALNFKCKFVTADEKLYKKVKDLGFVELL